MTHEFKMQRTVEFAETDMAGIMHFSNYFRYMEVTEHAFFRSLGLKVHTHSPSGVWGWARGHAECSFRKPLCYEDVVELHLLVREKRSRSITYEVIFRRQQTDGGSQKSPTFVEVARGSITVICIAKPGEHGQLSAMLIPPEIDSLIETAPDGSGEERGVRK